MASRLSRTGGGTNTLGLSQRYRTRYRAEICWAIMSAQKMSVGHGREGAKGWK